MSTVGVVLRRDGRPSAREELTPVLAAAWARGSHGTAIWDDTTVALGYQHRWSLSEDPRPRQPWRHGPSGCVITFDGRLDNRAALRQRWVVDSQTTDAQLALLTYLDLDIQAPSQLEGDFAFAIWDPRLPRLFVARDRLGVRPLAYHVDEQVVVVGSEVAQVRAHSAVEGTLDEVNLATFLASRWEDSEHTVFRDVRWLPPGHCGEFTPNTMQLWSYWQLKVSSELRFGDVGEAADCFRERLERSVQQRLRGSDGHPVGVSLSGGPDSSYLAAIACRQTEVHAISYVFDRYPSCDESALIRETTQYLGLDPNLILGDKLAPCTDTPVVFPDFPGQDPYRELAMAVADRAGELGCRQLFNGHYADLLFAGGQFWAGATVTAGRLGTLLGSIRKDGVTPALQSLRCSVGGSIRRTRRSPVRRLGHLGPRLLESPEVRRILEQRRSRDLLGGRARRREHLLLSAIPRGHAAARRQYARRGVELVDPFWTPELLELAISVPADFLQVGSLTKRLLRIAAHGAIPASVCQRLGKTTLFPLMQAGFESEAGRKELTHLADPRAQVVQRGLVDAGWLSEQVQGITVGRGTYPLWSALTLERWLGMVEKTARIAA